MAEHGRGRDVGRLRVVATVASGNRSPHGRASGAARVALTASLVALWALNALSGATAAAPGASKRAAFPQSDGHRSAASVVRADLITHVFPETGQRVVAIALNFNRDLVLRPGTAAARSAFAVTVSLPDVTGPRTVTDVYTNNGPEPATRRSKGVVGRYLILELDPADANASVNFVAADGATAPRQMVGAYSIMQSADVRDDRGVLLPARPFAISNDGVINPVVDDFARMSFTDVAGTKINFRFFEPERAGSRHPSGRLRTYPLVLHLHGGGETGSPLVTPNNVTQITANRGAIVWATPERQARHPSFVVAPQLPGRTSQWTEPAIRAAVLAIVDQIVATYPVDANRIYLSGLSRGARGGVDFLSNRPETFAGALLSAARADSDDVSKVPQMAAVPLWAVHAVDDPVVPYSGTVAIMAALEAAGVRVTRGEWAGNNSQGPAQDQAAEAAARALLRQAEATGSHTLFTTYTAGTVAVNAHFSWGPMYETDVMLDWLFAQNVRKRSPRVGSARTKSARRPRRNDRRIGVGSPVDPYG